VVGFKNGVKPPQVLVQKVGGINAEIEFVLPVHGPHVEVMVGCGTVVCNRRIRRSVNKILNIDSELVEIVGDTKRQELVLITVERQVVGERQAGPLLPGVPVTVVIKEYPQSGPVADTGIRRK